MARFEETLDKVKKVSLDSAAIFLLFGGIFKILSVELASFKDILNVEELLHILPTILIWLLAVFALLALIYFFVFLLRRQTANTTDFKREVTVAFINALEHSSFNPHRLEGTNEQHRPRTTK